MLPLTGANPNSCTTPVVAPMSSNEPPMSIDDRMEDTILCAGIQLGEIRGTLMCEFKGLSSENGILAAKITQLEMIHAYELNAAVDGYVSARNLIVEKLKNVIERFKTFPENFKRCGYVPLDPTPFENIINDINTKVLESHYNEIKKYPEYCDKRLSKGIRPEKVAIVPFSIGHYPLQFQIQSRIIKTAEEIKSLGEKIAFLRNDNHALTEKIDVMIDFHRKHLEDLNRLEKLGKIKAVVERVRAIYDNIKWEVSVINCDDCKKDVYGMSANVAAVYLPVVHKQNQGLVNEKLNAMREHVLMVVTSLEALIL